MASVHACVAVWGDECVALLPPTPGWDSKENQGMHFLLGIQLPTEPEEWKSGPLSFSQTLILGTKVELGKCPFLHSTLCS